MLRVVVIHPLQAETSMPYSIHRSGKQCAGRSGFTLIELLIVVGIIAILIVLGLSVAGKVTGVGKKSATEQTLRTLDTALGAYIQASGGSLPPAFLTDPRPNNNGGKYVQPIIDGRCESTGQMVNSVGFFMFQCKAIPDAAAALKHLDSKYLREYTPDAIGATGWDAQMALPTAFDGWGHPIRYVHPLFKGIIPPSPAAPTMFVPTTSIQPAPPGTTYGIAGIRRNNTNSSAGVSPPDADSDGGLNPATRPYFYSAGPDGDPSTVADNIYITVPRVQKN
jgi:prepilin-type N-terminal cleavage/methylation domain-containing protein